MTGSEWIARTHGASGRFLCLVVVGWWAIGCQVPGADTPAPPGARSAALVVSPGPITQAEQDEAAGLLEEAQRSFASRRYLESLRFTNDLLDRLAASDVSGAALLLTARSEFGAGAFERGDAAAERYIGLLPAGDERAAGVRLIQAEGLDGQPFVQVDRLLRIEANAPVADVRRALPMARAAADSLSRAELELLVEGAPDDGPVAPPVLARLAVDVLADGQEEQAARLAAAGLAAGATGPDLAVLEGVLRGELPEGLRPIRTFRIATVLPVGGPPALADYAALIAEGVEVAVATVLGDAYQVGVVEVDDRADPEMAAQAIRQLEDEGVTGIVGFLLDDALVAAGTARQRGLPVVSPSARSAQLAGEAVYSLQGADPIAAQSVALYAVERAFQRVAMIYPATPDATEEADVFQVIAEGFGIPIVGRYPYEAGATDFEDQFRLAQASLRAAEIAALGLSEDDTLFVEMLEPVGLFMPIPPEDVEFVALQFAHNGLDTLAVEVMGTSGWTDPQGFEPVDPRLLTGIVATAPIRAGPGSEGYARFQAAYEELYQRSLVSSTPAVGYDATMLLLEALRPGRIRPAEVVGALRSLVDVEGATGVFSIVEDRIVRRTQLIRFEGNQLVPLANR